MTITVIRSGTVITGDGRTSLPDTDVVLVDGVVRDLPHSDPDRSFGQADLVIDATRQVVIPGLINNHTHGTAFGPLFPSAHTALSEDDVLRNLDRHLLEGTTVLCVDGFITAEQIARTNQAHPMNVKLASCNIPDCLHAARIADGSGLRRENVEFTADVAVEQGAVALGEIGAGHTLGGGGTSYLYIPAAVQERTGVKLTARQATRLKYAVLGRHIDSQLYHRDTVAEVLVDIGLAGRITAWGNIGTAVGAENDHGQPVSALTRFRTHGGPCAVPGPQGRPGRRRATGSGRGAGGAPRGRRSRAGCSPGRAVRSPPGRARPAGRAPTRWCGGSRRLCPACRG